MNPYPSSFTFGSAALKFPIDPSALNFPPDLAALPSHVRFTEAERRVFRSRERDPRTGLPITVSQWAERYREVVGGSRPGRWRNENSPYAIRPMELWTEPSVREIILCFAPQVVKTQIAFNCLGYCIDQDPGSAMYVMPDEKTAKRISWRRLLPMIKRSPRLAALLSERSESTTRLAIRFMNGMDLMMAWASSVAEISSEDVRYLILDEVDKFPDYAGREADPVSLARVRTNSYPYTKKILILSTPGAEPSRITGLMRYDADETYRLSVRCPICGHGQIMDDEHIVVLHARRDPRDIVREKLGRYSCAGCGFFWDDYTRDQAVRRGVWVPGRFDAEGEWRRSDPVIRPVSVAFHLPAWYSLQESLSEVAAARIRGEHDIEKKMVYITQKRVEEYKETVERKKESEIIRNRTDLPSGIVPKGALALTAGIDSHKWGYRFSVFAWVEDKIGFSCYKIHHGTLGTLDDVRAFVFEARYQMEGSADTMGIWRAGIDTGGNKANDIDTTMTEEIYQWLGSVPPGVIYGIKGASHKQPVNVRPTVIEKYSHSQKPIPGGLVVYFINTDAMKDIIHWMLSHGEGEANRFFFDADTLDTDDPYVRELLAEESRRLKNGRTQWVRVRMANHYLDTAVIAHACADSTWQPSLKLLTAYIKGVRAGQGEAGAKQEDAAQFPERSTQSGSRW